MPHAPPPGVSTLGLGLRRRNVQHLNRRHESAALEMVGEFHDQSSTASDFRRCSLMTPGGALASISFAVAMFPPSSSSWNRFSQRGALNLVESLVLRASST